MLDAILLVLICSYSLFLGQSFLLPHRKVCCPPAPSMSRPEGTAISALVDAPLCLQVHTTFSPHKSDMFIPIHSPLSLLHLLLNSEKRMTNYHSRSGNDTLKLCGRHTCLPVALLLPLKVSPPLLHHLKETRGCPLEFRKKWAAYLPSIMLCSWLPPLPPWFGIALCLPGSGSEAGCGANSGKQVSKDACLVLGSPFLFIQAGKLWIRETAVPKTSLVNQ